VTAILAMMPKNVKTSFFGYNDEDGGANDYFMIIGRSYASASRAPLENIKQLSYQGLHFNTKIFFTCCKITRT
jgi:hypothetical protein